MRYSARISSFSSSADCRSLPDFVEDDYIHAQMIALEKNGQFETSCYNSFSVEVERQKDPTDMPHHYRRTNTRCPRIPAQSALITLRASLVDLLDKTSVPSV
jgi:hypothetical protein